ncbi:hypothetical protein V8C35DRAFT_116514 [Trichoderma chlorosporum]
MATEADLLKVEQAFDYTFGDKHLLQIALTSPGVERDNHHGNRLLARVGQAALEMVIAQAGYESSATTATINDEQDFIDSKAQLSLAAEETGIAACIKLCQRSGPPSIHVKSQAMRAIIGAAWEDSDQSLGTVMAITQKLMNGFGNLLKQPGVKIPNVSENTAASPQPIMANLAGPMQQAWTSCSDLDGSDERPSSSSNSGLLYVALEPPVISNDFFTTQMLGTVDGSVSINGLNFFGDYIVPDAIQLDKSDNASTELNHDSFSDFHIDELIQSQPKDIILSKLGSSSLSANAVRDLSSSMYSGFQVEMRPGTCKRSRTGKDQAGVYKRRRIAPDHTCREWLVDYISEERERCKEHNLPDPGDTYLRPDILRKTMDLGGKRSDELLKILVGICSPSSVIALRATLQTMRSASDLREHMPLHGLSAPERFKAIEREESCIAESTLLRRCHIWKLWKEHCSSAITSTTVSHEWVLAHRPGLEQNGPGNPRIMQRCVAASALMDKIFPELNRDSREFKHKYNQIKQLEKLGRRLSMMAETFGEGILGLLQCSESDAAFLKISDSMFLKPTDCDFRDFLSLLDRTQRDFIYKCSRSVTPILECIMDGTLKERNLFPLERNQPEQILGMPKGSQSLLYALTYVL